MTPAPASSLRWKSLRRICSLGRDPVPISVIPTGCWTKPRLWRIFHIRAWFACTTSWTSRILCIWCWSLCAAATCLTGSSATNYLARTSRSFTFTKCAMPSSTYTIGVKQISFIWVRMCCWLSNPFISVMQISKSWEWSLKTPLIANHSCAFTNLLVRLLRTHQSNYSTN